MHGDNGKEGELNGKVHDREKEGTKKRTVVVKHAICVIPSPCWGLHRFYF